MRRYRDIPWAYIGTILGFTLAGIVGLHLVDLGANELIKGGGNLCNGMWCTNANTLFHIGLYAGYGAIGALTLITLATLWRSG